MDQRVLTGAAVLTVGELGYLFRIVDALLQNPSFKSFNFVLQNKAHQHTIYFSPDESR